jgi:hypothetical protein
MPRYNQAYRGTPSLKNIFKGGYATRRPRRKSFRLRVGRPRRRSKSLLAVFLGLARPR